MADGRAKNGGKRKGAGRKRRPAYKPDGELTPLDYMLHVMRTSRLARLRMEAAKAAAPYCHARLAQTDLNVAGDLTVQLVSYLDDPNPKP